MAGYLRRLKDTIRRIIRWADEKIPRGVRSGLGVLLLIGGVFSILPVLGIWMIPAGLAMIALDVPPWRRWLKKRVDLEHGSGAKS